MENPLWFLKRFEIFFVPLRQSRCPPPTPHTPNPKRAGGRRVTSVKRHYSIKLQLPAAERAPLDRLPTCQSRDPVRFKGEPEVTPSAPPGARRRALITLRQVYLESSPEKEQRREDGRFFTGGAFLSLARGHSGRTTNTHKKTKQSRVKEK